MPKNIVMRKMGAKPTKKASNTKGKKKSKATSNKPVKASSKVVASASGSSSLSYTGVSSNTKKTLFNDYVKALLRPFDSTSYGVRVPDPWSFPTTTYHLHGTVVATAPASGQGTLMFCPGPLLSLIDVGVDNAHSSVVTSSGMNPIANNTTLAFQATTPAKLSAVFQDYRVPSWGIKISNLQPELSATGRIIIFQIPCGDQIPGDQVINAAAMSAGVLTQKLTGGTAAVIDSSSVLNYPTAQEFAVQDMLHGDLQIAGSYVNPIFFDFKMSTSVATFNGTFSEADDTVWTTATGVVSGASGNRDPSRQHGGVMIGIHFEGFPSGGALQIEWIQHLEGTPTLASLSAGQTPVSSMMPVPCIGNTNIVEAAMSCTSGNNAFTWLDKGADFLNTAASAVTKIASGPIGMAIGSMLL